MHINWLEWLGYLASLIVLISLLMSSILKLRWINLAGSCMFSLYGFLIGSLPVGFMNLGIAIINIYYLIKIYTTKEYFKILPTDGNSQYFKYFLDFYKTEIENSIILEGSEISEVGSRIDESLIGREVKIYKCPPRPSVYRFMVGDKSEIGIK